MGNASNVAQQNGQDTQAVANAKAVLAAAGMQVVGPRQAKAITGVAWPSKTRAGIAGAYLRQVGITTGNTQAGVTATGKAYGTLNAAECPIHLANAVHAICAYCSFTPATLPAPGAGFTVKPLDAAK